MASFGLKYFAELRSRYKGVFWRVEIAERDYSGLAEEMEFSGNDPVCITWENRGDEFFVPVKASEATVTVMCRENFRYIGLFTSDPRRYRVSVYRNTVLYWRGFVVADLYSESFTAPPYEVSIKAVDGFNLLSNVPFLNSDNTKVSGLMSLWQLLSDCISLLELNLGVADWMDLYAEGMDERISPLRQVYVDMERFYFVYDKPTYRDVLELCLRPFSAQIFQSGGSLHLRRAVSLYRDSRPLSFYDVGAEFPMGWLVTSDGRTIVSHAGEPLVTTMSREWVDSMWGEDINVLGGATLEIVPAIRRVDVRVRNKLLGSLVDQMGIYDLELWSAPEGLLSLSQPDSLSLKGNSDYSGTILWHDGCHVDKSACRLIFKMNITTSYHYRYVSGSGTRPPDTEKTIIVEYGFRLTGSGATYYLDEDGSWQTEQITISEGVKTSEGSERSIEMEGFPASGQLQFFIVQCLSGYSTARNSQWQSANFSQMSITLDTEEAVESDPSYGLAVNAANNTDMEISIPISDIPNIPNDRLLYSLYLVTQDGQPTRMWHTKGGTDYNPLVSHLMACALKYKQLPARRIAGDMFTGTHVDMNTVVQDDRYLHAGFYVNSVQLNALEDSYDAELVEMPLLLRSETPPERDDCILLKEFPFTVEQAVRCVNRIAMLGSDGVLYVYDTITGGLYRVMECADGTVLYPADDSYVVSDAVSLQVIDYRGYTLKRMERDYLTPATFMGESVYGIARFNVGRNGAVSWSYYLGKLGGTKRMTFVRTTNYESNVTSFGDDPQVSSIVKSYSSLVINAATGAYLHDMRIHDGTLTTFFADSVILSLSDYFMCLREVAYGPLKIYRRDTLSEQTLVRSVAQSVTVCDHTLSEVAYAYGTDGANVRVWDYRSNTERMVINAQGAGRRVKGLFFINGSLYILRDRKIFKYIPEN